MTSRRFRRFSRVSCHCFNFSEYIKHGWTHANGGLPTVFTTTGGAFLFSACQSAFANRLIHTLASTLPDINPFSVLGVGATDIRNAFGPAQVPLVVDAYVAGLKYVWAITIAGFGTATLIGFLGSWKKILGDEARGVVAGGA
jgi:MFS transporter, DHA2 family, glioxin efflux transporter